MTIDPQGHGDPPTIDLRTGSVTFSSVPRLVVGIAVALVALAFVGWLAFGALFDAPWYVAAPASVLMGAAYVAWQVKSMWRGYAASIALWVGGLAWLVWWWLEHGR